MCTSTFQNFIDRHLDSKLPPALDKGLSAWLLQESFNTICAATNTVVEVCAGLTLNHPDEERKMLQGLLDLLLHILTTPQSSVTHLRAVGGALQALERFGVELFTEIAGTNFQYVYSAQGKYDLRTGCLTLACSFNKALDPNYAHINEQQISISTIDCR